MKWFYGLGAILFLLMAGGSIWNLVIIWENITIGAKISSIANILFNFLICIVFLWLYKGSVVTTDISDEEVNRIIKENGIKSKI